MKQLKTAARLIALLLIGGILGLQLYSWNTTSLTGNILPMPLGVGSAVVLSGSMEPTIMTDELIIVKADDSYAEGDIVVYQNERILVVHRIVAMDEETVTTRGDANNADDAPVSRSQIKGTVIAHIPHMGALVRLLKTPVATIALILGAVLSIELPFRMEKEKKDEELERIKEEIRKLKEEQES